MNHQPDLGCHRNRLVTLDGFPVVCGGSKDNVGSETICSTTVSDCHRYVASSNTWEKSGNMSTTRRYSANAYTPATGLAMVAGEDDRCKTLGSVEATQVGFPTCSTGVRILYLSHIQHGFTEAVEDF